jgi:hypothetical protein
MVLLQRITINNSSKGDTHMVNQNFDKFREVQKKHQAVYIGGTNGSQQTPGINDKNYNNQEDTDKSVGATGRNLKG